jgi:cyclic pyranopterin monophosphate synthase
MLKAVDRAMRIEGIELVHKSGGKSGKFSRDEVASANAQGIIAGG